MVTMKARRGHQSPWRCNCQWATRNATANWSHQKCMLLTECLVLCKSGMGSQALCRLSSPSIFPSLLWLSQHRKVAGLAWCYLFSNMPLCRSQNTSMSRPQIQSNSVACNHECSPFIPVWTITSRRTVEFPQLKVKDRVNILVFFLNSKDTRSHLKLQRWGGNCSCTESRR